jgi:hypothetical protein
MKILTDSTLCSFVIIEYNKVVKINNHYYYTDFMKSILTPSQFDKFILNDRIFYLSKRSEKKVNEYLQKNIL